MTTTTLGSLLIVDDEERHATALSEVLRERGFRTNAFFSPVAALEELRSQSYDLLLTDLMMPEMDGIALLKSALEIDPDLAVVLMTGQGTVGNAVQALQAGAADYVLKPFKARDAIPAISRALEVRKLRRANAELHRLERQQAAELELRNQELAAFTAAVAHDLRSPLTTIDGFSWVLENDHLQQLDCKGQEALGLVRNASRKMRVLIEDLLKLARVTDAEIQKQPVDLSEMAFLISEELRRGGPDRMVEFLIVPGLVAFGDEGLLRIALENLIRNAWKFTSQQKEAHIWFGQDALAEGSPFYVKDDGAGFDAEYGHKLFKPFERLHSQAEFPGTGIGLTTVQRIVHRHGGTIRAAGEAGKGATFVFTLPRDTVRASQARESQAVAI